VAAEPDADEPLVQVLVRPRGEAGVDGALEGDELLADAAGRRDRDDHRHGGLEQQHFHVTDRRGLEAGRGDERQQPRHPAQHLGRGLERGLDLASHRGQVEREAGGARLLALEHLVRVEAVAGLGRDPAGRGVRMGEETERFQLRELAPHRRRGDGETGELDERLRADGIARGDVHLHHPPEDVALALADLLHLQANGTRVLSRDHRSEACAGLPTRRGARR
jgi:hypothetical protein